MTVLAAFSALLSRVTDQDDLVIATVVAHRDETDVEPLIGCFTKKVPLRLRVDGDVTFADLVGRTRTSLLGALSHQDIAFDSAVQEGLGGAAADHGVVPQVAVVFQGETPQQVRLSMPQLTIGPYEVRAEARRERHFSAGPDPTEARDAAPVWGDGAYLGTFLLLSLLETSGGLALVARGVFDRSAAQRLLDDFGSVLAEVVADPTRSVRSIPAPAASPGSCPTGPSTSTPCRRQPGPRPIPRSTCSPPCGPRSAAGHLTPAGATGRNSPSCRCWARPARPGS